MDSFSDYLYIHRLRSLFVKVKSYFTFYSLCSQCFLLKHSYKIKLR